MRDGVEAVYGITGPLYEQIIPQLPGADEPHVVPSGYWKILAITEGGGLLLRPSHPAGVNFCTGLTTIDDIDW